MLSSYYGEYISEIQHNAVIIVFLITFVIVIRMINSLAPGRFEQNFG